jgi:hypothetical protein
VVPGLDGGIWLAESGVAIRIQSVGPTEFLENRAKAASNLAAA